MVGVPLRSRLEHFDEEVIAHDHERMEPAAVSFDGPSEPVCAAEYSGNRKDVILRGLRRGRCEFPPSLFYTSLNRLRTGLPGRSGGLLGLDHNLAKCWH